MADALVFEMEDVVIAKLMLGEIPEGESDHLIAGKSVRILRDGNRLAVQPHNKLELLQVTVRVR